MTRFHFDISDGGILKKDHEGIEFADFAAMQKDAIRAAGDMVGEKTSFPTEPWMMTIRVGEGEVVATLTFDAQYVRVSKATH